MQARWSCFAAPLRRAAIGTVVALALAAMATPAFDAEPAQAGGLPWPFPSHLSQPSHQAPPGQQAPSGAAGLAHRVRCPGRQHGLLQRPVHSLQYCLLGRYWLWDHRSG